MICVLVMSITPLYLDRCLHHVRPQVDSVQVLGNSERPEVNGELLAISEIYGAEYHEEEYGVTFAEGNNYLADQAPLGADLLFVNDDAVVSEGTVEKMDSHGADVTGVLIRNGDGTVNHAGIEWTDRGRGLLPYHLGKGEPLWMWQRRHCDPQSSATFATALVRREAWDSLGGLDEGYVWGFEDIDFGLRVRHAGGSVVICREGLVIHNEMSTRGKGNMNLPYERTLASVGNRDRLTARWIDSGKLKEILK